MKKFLSLLLALMMVLSTVSFALPSVVTVADANEEVYLPETNEVPEQEYAALAASDTWYDVEKGTLLFNMDFDENNSGSAVEASAYDGLSLGSYSAGAGELVSGLGRLNPDVADSSYDMGFRYSSSPALVTEGGNTYLSLNSSGSNQISLYLGNTYTKTGTYVFEYKYKLVSTGATTAKCIEYNTLKPTEGTQVAYTFNEWVTETAHFEVSSIPAYSRVMFYGVGNYSSSDKLYLDDIKVWYYDESVDYNEKVNGSTGGGEETESEWANTDKGYRLFVIDFETNNSGAALTSSDYSAITSGRVDSAPATAGVAVSAIGRVNPNYTVNARVNLKGGSGASLAGTDNKYMTVTGAPDSILFSQIYVGDGTYVFEFETNNGTVSDIRGSYNEAALPTSETVDGTWNRLSHTAADMTEALSKSCSSYATDNIRFLYGTKATMYDSIVVYYQPTGWTAPSEGGEEPEEPDTPVVEDVWEDETKGTKLFTIDFEAKNDGTAVDSSSWDTIKDRLDNNPSNGELITDIGRVNPDVSDASSYRISFNYIDNTKTELITDGDNKYLSVASDASHGDISLYLGGLYDGEGEYIIETSYKFIQKGSNTVDRIRYETLALEYTDSSYLSRGEWVDLSETHEHSSCSHADVNRTRFTTNGYNNNPFSADDRIYIDNITVYYKAPATEEPEPDVSKADWYDKTKGTLLYNADFENDNSGASVTTEAAANVSRSDGGFYADQAALISGLGRLNPDVSASNYTIGFRYVTHGTAAVATESGNKYFTINAGTSDNISFYLGYPFQKAGKYVLELNYKYIPTTGSGRTISGINCHTPSAANVTDVATGEWKAFSQEYTLTGASDVRLRFLVTGGSCAATDVICFDDIKVWYYDESVDYDEILGGTTGGGEESDEWIDETYGDKLFNIDFATKNDGSAVTASDISTFANGRLDGSASAGVAVSGVGKVNPTYASTAFRVGLKDANVVSLADGAISATTGASTGNMSLYFRDTYVGPGTYTYVFDYNTASGKTFTVHSGYSTSGTLTTEAVDDTWTRITYVVSGIDESNYLSTDTNKSNYLRFYSTGASAEGKFVYDNLAVYYKNTVAQVKVMANGNANVVDTKVNVDKENGDTVSNIIAKVDVSKSTKQLLGASLTANGELLAANYVVKPSEITEIYLIWGGDIVVDETPWFDEGYGTLLFNVNWDGTLSTASQTRWADVRAAGAVTNPDWKCFEKCYFMWGTEDIGGSNWVPASSPLIVAEANGNRYYTQPHNSTYNSWSIYSTLGGDWANWADTAGVFTITYKIKTIGNITVNNLFIDPQTVKDHATVKQNIRLYSTERPDSSGWTTVTYQVDLSDYDVSEGESLGHVLLYAQTNESSAVSGAYICYDDVKVYYKPSTVNVTLNPGTNLEVNETTVEVTTKGILVSDLIALVNTEDTTMLATGITSEDGSKKYALTDTVVLDADTTFYITWEANDWMDNEKGMLIQRVDFEGAFSTSSINRWPAATDIGATINPDYYFQGITGLQFTVSETGIAFDPSMLWVPADYDKTENGNTYFEVPTGNVAYGSQQYTCISMYAMGSGASQYQYQGAGTYTITGKIKYGTDIQNATLELRPNLYNGEGGLSGGYNYSFEDIAPGEWNDFSVTWSTAENSEYGLGSVYFYLFYDALSSKSTIAYDDIMLYYKPFTAEVTLRANNNPVAKDIVLSDVSTSGITVEELISNIRTPLGGMDLVGLAYDKAGTNMLEGNIVIGGDSRFFMIWEESELDPNAPIVENINSLRTDDPAGLRFKSYMTAEAYENADVVGWVITRYDMLEAKAINPYDFYLDTNVTKVYAYNKNTDGTNKVFDSDDETTFITAVLYNIPAAHYETTLVARPYSKVGENVYYGYPAEKSICEVAEALRDSGYAGCTNDQIVYIKGVLTSCGKTTEPQA